MPDFRVSADVPAPTGDQPRAIASLADRNDSRTSATRRFWVRRARARRRRWRGRSRRCGKPALVIAHNKTLAAQLCNEFREFFPDNAVEYFVSYYDYYQPEAYVPQADLYIEKDSSLNDDIARLRLAATSSLFTPPRRRRRRVGLVHLRARLARGVARADDRTPRSATSTTATSCCGSSSTSSTCATTRCSVAAAFA